MRFDLTLLEAQVWLNATRLQQMTEGAMSPQPVDPASHCVYKELCQRMKVLHQLIDAELQHPKDTYRGGYIAALNNEVQQISTDSCWLAIRMPDAPDYQLAKQVVLGMKFFFKKK